MEIFLKLTGISGNSQNPDHKAEIELLSWSWLRNQNLSGTSGSTSQGTSKAEFTQIGCTKPMDSASTLLAQYAGSGKLIREAKLTADDAKNDKEITLTLTDVLIASYQVGGSASGGNVVESFTLDFASYQSKYAHLANGPTGQGMGGSVDDDDDVD